MQSGSIQKREICEGEEDYWLIPMPEGTSAEKERLIVERSIRPYRILIQEIKEIIKATVILISATKISLLSLTVMMTMMFVLITVQIQARQKKWMSLIKVIMILIKVKLSAVSVKMYSATSNVVFTLSVGQENENSRLFK